MSTGEGVNGGRKAGVGRKPIGQVMLVPAFLMLCLGQME